jgi:hypothetical protein
MSTTKYRPYLSLSELKHLAGLCRLDSPTSSLSLYLSRYIEDIDSGFRKANHVKTGVSLEEKLMLAELPNPDDIPAIQKEKKHRYENDLMSPQEEKDYLREQGVIFK